MVHNLAIPRGTNTLTVAPTSSSTAGKVTSRSHKEATPAPGYMPQLDGLRAYAVGVVLIQHWARWGPLPWGKYGVDLFFVLSGFLITSILLATKARTDTSRLRRIRHFYIRRYLRITPVFYATLVITCLAGYIIVRQTFWWHILYLSNFLFVLKGGAALQYVSHFWSLAVEEQFYLVWPWLIVFLPLRYLKPMFVSLIVVAPLWRIFFQYLHPSLMQALPIAYGDTLGIGSYLAYHNWAHQGRRVESRSFQWAALLGVVSFTLCTAARLRTNTSPLFLEDTALAFCFGWLIIRAANGFHNSLSNVIGNSAIRYIGKISYGIYIFHNFAPRLTSRFTQFIPAHAHLLHQMPVKLMIDLILTISVASVSWHVFEKPINNLKRYFPY
jgi:peptidoglycan/LPS O-acetylase OafA/YrhL